MDRKLVLTDSSCMTTGHGRVGHNRLLNGVELHTTGCVWFDPVFSTLTISMNRLQFRFEPKREKNQTEPDPQTLHRCQIRMEFSSFCLFFCGFNSFFVCFCFLFSFVCFHFFSKWSLSD